MDQVNGNESPKSPNESGITMVDVLKEEEELEDETAAVLGAGDETLCTYDQGYMTRQALYACQTCLPADKGVSGGICLGCSFHCHEGHDLVELYTKRNFRCDCGNSKYPESNSCKLTKDKLPVNPENSYNQNFSGKYCSCSRPYPDPEDNIEDQMIQCIICEDWCHGRHLEVDVLPNEEEFSEMICGKCFPKFEFLQSYLGLSVTVVADGDKSADSDAIAVDDAKDKSVLTSENKEICDNDTKVEPKKEICNLIGLKKLPYKSGAVFFGSDWRKELCSCPSCLELYSTLKVSYLVNPEDTVSDYECKGREKRQSERGVQREIDALSSLDRITRTEVVHEYNNLSSSLREYLKKFADSGKVVRDEDIKEFFSQLSANKRQKKDGGMQFFCK